jgi:hypothetical protein
MKTASLMRSRFTLELPRDVKEAVRRLATDERRSLRAQIEALIAEGLEKRGYLKPPKSRKAT